jgi:hypothetical protein
LPPDIVPRAHHHAIVDRDRHDRRMRKKETHGHRGRQAERTDDLGPAVAVVAQAVQPDHGGVGIRSGFELDRRQ